MFCLGRDYRAPSRKRQSVYDVSLVTIVPPSRKRQSVHDVSSETIMPCAAVTLDQGD